MDDPQNDRAKTPQTPARDLLSVPDHRDVGLDDGLVGLQQLMRRLLAPDGCPWDRKQTLETLRHYLVEEVYEVLDAMDDPAAHRAELGDLLFQIVFQSAIRESEGHFGLDEVIEGIRTKMLRRHPHVFGPRDSSGAPTISADDVEQQWEQIKAAERAAAGRDAGAAAAHPQPLASIPKALPALARARRMQEKAAALGFDWPDVGGAVAKFHEEWAEFEEARASGDPSQIRDEFGDLLFVLVRLGQKVGVDAEDALRGANEKFDRRFDHVMRACFEADLDPATAGLQVLDGYWDEAKRRERSKPANPPEHD